MSTPYAMFGSVFPEPTQWNGSDRRGDGGPAPKFYQCAGCQKRMTARDAFEHHRTTGHAITLLNGTPVPFACCAEYAPARCPAVAS